MCQQCTSLIEGLRESCSQKIRQKYFSAPWFGAEDILEEILGVYVWQ